MTFSHVSAAFTHAFKAFSGLFDFDRKGREKRIRYFALAIGSLALLVALLMLYRWYTTSREQSAQKAFSQQVALFGQARKPEQLESATIELKSAHDQYASSNLAPYFTAYEVDALLAQGKNQEALASLDEIIASLSSSNPVINLYKTKRALLKFDIDDAAVNQAGLQELEQLAQDKKNTNRDIALFYLGLHYYVADNFADAKKVWVDLVEQSMDEKNSSPWAEQAKQRLESLA